MFKNRRFGVSCVVLTIGVIMLAFSLDDSLALFVRFCLLVIIGTPLIIYSNIMMGEESFLGKAKSINDIANGARGKVLWSDGNTAVICFLNDDGEEEKTPYLVNLAGESLPIKFIRRETGFRSFA